MDDTDLAPARASDTNVVVAANLKALRKARRLTQAQVADRLGARVGRPVSDVTISQMEAGGYGADRRRRRRYDAQDLVDLAAIFDVPVVYFFLPRPGDVDVARQLRHVLGACDAGISVVDARLRDLASGSCLTMEILAALDDRFSTAKCAPTVEEYLRWRTDRLAAIETTTGDELLRLADALAGLAAAVQQAGPDGFLRHLDGQERSPALRESVLSCS